MAKLAGKGSAFKVTISGTLTAIAAVISIDLPEQKMETFEADTLDNLDAGIPHQPTGRTEGGEAGLELFFDPSVATHSLFTSWLNETSIADMTKVCAITFGPAPAGTWTFTGVGVTLGGKIALNDGIKANVKVKLSKTITAS